MTDEEIVGLAAAFIEMTNDVYVDFMPSNLIAFARAIEARSLPANERVRDEAYERAAKDAERYRWLHERFIGYDFDWMPSEESAGDGKSVICFNVGRTFRGSADLTASLDANMKDQQA